MVLVVQYICCIVWMRMTRTSFFQVGGECGRVIYFKLFIWLRLQSLFHLLKLQSYFSMNLVVAICIDHVMVM